MVKRFHTRKLRYLPKGPERNRLKRFKTFTDESKAKAYAESLGKGYKAVKSNYGLSKKYKIIFE